MTLMTRMFLLKSRDSGNERASASHDEIDLNARLGGAVERGDDFLVDQCVDLRDNSGFHSRLGGLGLGFDMREKTAVKLCRCRDQVLETFGQAAPARRHRRKVGRRSPFPDRR